MQLILEALPEPILIGMTIYRLEKSSILQPISSAAISFSAMATQNSGNAQNYAAATLGLTQPTILRVRRAITPITRHFNIRKSCPPENLTHLHAGQIQSPFVQSPLDDDPLREDNDAR